MRCGEVVLALYHPAFNQPVEGEVSISVRRWDHGTDIQIEIDEHPVLSIPADQLYQFRELLNGRF